MNPLAPTESDLKEPIRFLGLLEELGIRLVNITAGSPYYNPHLSDPPSIRLRMDTCLPKIRSSAWRDRWRQPAIEATVSEPDIRRDWLQLPAGFPANVAQAAIREGWVDMVGLGRMVLTYPELLWDASEGRTIERKRICRTFSDCTTAPRKGLPSGCYPLDSFYKDSELMTQLTLAKKP